MKEILIKMMFWKLVVLGLKFYNIWTIKQLTQLQQEQQQQKKKAVKSTYGKQ